MTFVDNHDTGSTQKHWPFPSDHVGAGYAYILTHPGIPCVFWDHYFTWGAELHNTIHTLASVSDFVAVLLWVQSVFAGRMLSVWWTPCSSASLQLTHRHTLPDPHRSLLLPPRYAAATTL